MYICICIYIYIYIEKQGYGKTYVDTVLNVNQAKLGKQETQTCSDPVLPAESPAASVGIATLF